MVATSRDKHAPNAMATEVTRVASKNIKDGGNINEQFQACSSILSCLSCLLHCFQIQNLQFVSIIFQLWHLIIVQSSLSCLMELQWTTGGSLPWSSNCSQGPLDRKWYVSFEIFPIYTANVLYNLHFINKHDKENFNVQSSFFFQPNQVGSCGIPLKSILKSDSFHLDSSLDIQENSISRPGSASRRGGSDVEGFYGKLKVSVQIVKGSFLKTACKGWFLISGWLNGHCLY